MNTEDFTIQDALKAEWSTSTIAIGIAVVCVIIFVIAYKMRSEGLLNAASLLTPPKEHAQGVINENRLSKTGMGRK
jgi:hypothetical protein